MIMIDRRQRNLRQGIFGRGGTLHEMILKEGRGGKGRRGVCRLMQQERGFGVQDGSEVGGRDLQILC